MDTRRKAYLRAMGVELWQSRVLAEQGAPEDLTQCVPASDAGTAAEPLASERSPSLSADSPEATVLAGAHDAFDTKPEPTGQPVAAEPVEQAPTFEQIPADAYADPGYFESDSELHDFDDELFSPDPLAKLNWPELAERVSVCRGCELAKSRTQTVFGVGDQHAKLLVIGEAPGADEDRQGEPFVGRAGQLLNSMLLAIGLRRDQVYIANILKCRPPNNRDPLANEVAACQGYLNRQIALIQPTLILSVGGVSAKNLLSTDQPVGRLRGKVHQYPATQTPLIVTYHPAYLLRKPSEKAKVWRDLKQAYHYLKQAQGE